MTKLMQFCSPNFHFKETRFVNFLSDPELSSSLYWQRYTEALALQVDIGDAVRAADLLVDGVLAAAVAQ